MLTVKVPIAPLMVTVLVTADQSFLKKLTSKGTLL